MVWADKRLCYSRGLVESRRRQVRRDILETGRPRGRDGDVGRAVALPGISGNGAGERWVEARTAVRGDSTRLGGYHSPLAPSHRIDRRWRPTRRIAGKR